MSLKELSTEEMVSVSEPWVSPGPARDALLGCAETRGLIERIEATRRTLLEAQPRAADPRLGAIVTEAAAMDLRHDQLARGLDGLLEALVLLTSDPARAEALGKLRSLLLPTGVSLVNSTYRNEAGAGALLEERLRTSAEATRLLGEVQVDGAPLRAHVDAWLQAARRLGALEDERAKIQSSNPSDARRHMDARNAWIRLVNALIANAALGAMDEDTELEVFGPLRRAEAAHARRKAAPPAPTPSADQATVTDEAE